MPLAEVEHLVEHHVGQALDLGDAVADLADDAHGLPGSRGLRARDLRFDFLQQVSHKSLTRRSHNRASRAASWFRMLPS